MDLHNETPESIHNWIQDVFPHRTRNTVIIKLFEEIGEFVKHPTEEELADIFIVLYDLAVMHDMNVQRGINHKMQINRARRWVVDPTTGVLNHVK